MHAAITPRDPKAIPKDVANRTIQALEDGRVNSGLKLSGVDISCQHWTSEMHASFAMKAAQGSVSLLEGARCLIAKRGTGDGVLIRAALSATMPKAVEIAESLAERFLGSHEAKGQLAPWSDSVTFSRALEAECEADPEPEEESQPQLGGSGEGEGESQPQPSAGGPPAPPEDEKEESPPEAKGGTPESLTEQFQPQAGESQKLPEITDEEIQDLREFGLDTYGRAIQQFRYGHDEPKGWGELKEIQTPRLDKRIQFKKMLTVKTQAASEGSIPRHMHRYATDQRIFTRKGKRRGGAAILIDVSGSMSFSLDELEEIIRQCPAAIIALYSGQPGRHGNKSAGYIRIVAQDRKYSPLLNMGMPGGNVIDGPAMDWLAARKEKTKLWISDGKVTGGTEGRLSGADLRKLARTMKRAGIERVGNVRSLLASGTLIDKAFDDGRKVGESD